MGLLFGVLLNVVALLGLPAFSKANTKKEGLRIFWTVIGAIALFSVCLFEASLLAPELMLKLLGSKYASLTVELQITVISTSLAALVAAIWGFLTARGLVGLSWIYIVATLTAQITYAFVGDLHTVRGVLWLGVVTSGAHLLTMIFQAYWLILRPRELRRNQ